MLKYLMHEYKTDLYLVRVTLTFELPLSVVTVVVSVVTATCVVNAGEIYCGVCLILMTDFFLLTFLKSPLLNGLDFWILWISFLIGLFLSQTTIACNINNQHCITCIISCICLFISTQWQQHGPY